MLGPSKTLAPLAYVALGLLTVPAMAGFVPVVGPDDAPEVSAQDPEQIKAIKERLERYTQPGPHHEVLGRFVGTWDVVAQTTMGGRAATFAKGEWTFDWLIAGRWLRGEMVGKLEGPMAQLSGETDVRVVLTMGYDNFKRSYVTSQVQSLDTAMVHTEGDLTRDGKALITYGTLDEYLTGEHDKMARYVWRFVGEDEIRLEVHDLPIGEQQTQVLGYVFTRKE